MDKIGQGGMGMVFKALHRRMDRVVAVKVLPPSMVKSTSSIQRFQREVRAAAKLEHPNIVAAFDADESAGTHFLVMQFVNGKDLAAKVREDGRLSIVKAIDYIQQAAKGLAYAHGLNIIHRDIKPANLLLDNHDIVRVLDLGLARILGDTPHLDDQLTQSGHIMGTVDYMAPEQALNTRSADARADIYSLGATFWYLVTAEPLYSGESMVQKLIAHQNAPLRVLSEVRSDATNEIDVWLQRMIAKSPDERFQSMVEVIQSLDDLRLQANIHGDPDPPRSPGANRTEISNSAVTLRLDQSLVDSAAKSSESIRIKTLPPIHSKSTFGKAVNQANLSKFGLSHRSWWLAAGSFSLLVIAAMVVFIRNSNGTAARIEVPERSTVENPLSEAGVATLPVTSQPIEKESPVAQWEDMFDGSSTTAWSTLGPFHVQDNLLVANGGRSNAISKDQYSDFELEAVWKIGAGANGGIEYRDDPNQAVVAGNEYQIADHHSNPAIYPPENQTASLYGLIAPSEDVMYPSGQWNTTRIVCVGTKIEHWLNQRKVLEYDTASDSFIALKRSSRFAAKNLIGRHQNNFLVLQSINGELSFRSIRIRRLTTGEIDLLAGLDVSKRNTQEMKWQLTDGVPIGEGIAPVGTDGWCSFEFDREVSGDYEFEFEFNVDHIFPLHVDLPLGDKQVIRVDLSPHCSGLIVIDGIHSGIREFTSPFTNQDCKLEHGVWQKLKGEIRQQGDNVSIDVKLDGIALGKFVGSRARISFPYWVALDPAHAVPDRLHVRLQGLGDLSKVGLQIRRAVISNIPAGELPLPQ